MQRSLFCLSCYHCCVYFEFDVYGDRSLLGRTISFAKFHHISTSQSPNSCHLAAVCDSHGPGSRSFLWTVNRRGFCSADFTVFGTDVMQGMRGFYPYLFLLFYLTPLSVISVLYGLVRFKLWRRKMPGLVTSETERLRGATKRKVVRTLIIITAVFAVCWLPTQAYHLIFGFDYGLHEQLPQIVMYMCFWLGHTNSAFNPWLYMLLTDKFRRALRDFIHCKFSSLGLRPETSVKYTQYTSVRDNSLVKRPPSTTRLRGNGLLKASDEEETPI